MALIKSNYFESKNVKVFPTAFRGSYTIATGPSTGQQSVFDPEARLYTEYNFTNIGGNNGFLKSYIINFNNSTKQLKCVIGGYYFEISNIVLSDFFDNTGKVKTMYIKTSEVEIQQSDDINIPDSTRTTKVLANIETEDAALDALDTTNNKYYFTGIKLTSNYEEALSGSAHLQPFCKDLSGNIVINNKLMQPRILSGKGYSTSDGSLIVDSIVLGTDTEALGSNSLASGNKSIANGDYSTAFGNNVVAFGSYAFASGKGTEYLVTVTDIDATNLVLTLNNTTYATNRTIIPGSLLLLKDTDNDLYYFYSVVNVDNINKKVTVDSAQYLNKLSSGLQIAVLDGLAFGQFAHSEGFDTKAIGEFSHSEGNITNSCGSYSHSEGSKTIAKGNYSHAEGLSTKAEEEGSHAEGNGTSAAAKFSHAEGKLTVAHEENSHAEGYMTTASGIASHAEGETGSALGEGSHVEGADCVAEGILSHAEGESSCTNANAKCSHAEGYSTGTIAAYSHSEGVYTEASGEGSHAEGVGENGSKLTASGYGSHAEGFKTEASGDYAHTEGSLTAASGEASHAEGVNTEATKKGAKAIGNFTLASGEFAFASGIGVQSNKVIASGNGSRAEGKSTKASGLYSHSEGNITEAKKEGAHAEGKSTTADGEYAHTEGYYTNATGNYSHAEGVGTDANKTIASGIAAHAEGESTVASGKNSHSEGKSTLASGENSHANGENTTASGKNSFAEGKGTIASGEGAHAEGLGSTIDGTSVGKATGNYSHVEGENCVASGEASHASGIKTTAAGKASFAAGTGTIASNENEFVCGKYNTETTGKTLFAIGNGTASEKKNAVEILVDDTKPNTGYIDLRLGGVSLETAFKNIMLNAVYPIGSIYTSLTTETDSSGNEICPIQKYLGGTWEAFAPGRMLVGVGKVTDAKSEELTFDINNTGGYLNSYIIKHTHTTTELKDQETLVKEDGSHSHTVSKRATAHDASKDDTFRSANSGKSGAVNINCSCSTEGSHTHKIDIPSLSTTEMSGDNIINDGTNKNLPPYYVVYMWRRVGQ